MKNGIKQQVIRARCTRFLCLGLPGALFFLGLLLTQSAMAAPGLPTITVQPISAVVTTGQTASLSATHIGTGPFGYQWIKDGALLVGQTNSTLSYTSFAFTNSGSYAVVITNAWGMAISLPASLSVSNAALLAWGNNSYGQLGNNTTISTNRPITVASNVVAMAAGGNHSLFITEDNTLWAMGFNGKGQLGNATLTSTNQPIQVTNDVVTTASGYNHSLFVKADGTLWAIGYNASGQLGIGTSGAGADINQPAQVTSNVVAVAGGGEHSLFIKADGTLWAMGYNVDGELGIGTWSNISLPTYVTNNVVAMAAGYQHSLFIKADGTLWAMGLNDEGQLGNGTYSNANLPIQLANNVVAMAAGAHHSLFVKADGTLWAMGNNNVGKLGIGTTIKTNMPVLVTNNVVEVSAGGDHSLFVKTDGALWAMGLNVYGQLGDGTTDESYVPVLVNNGDMLTASLAKGENAYHSLALAEVVPPSTSTWTVLNLGDSGADTLRDCLAKANSGDTIQFLDSLTGTVTLTSGPLNIASDVSIVGPGADIIAINGNASSRIFTATNCTALISGLTFSNGLASGSDGGALYQVGGNLTISNSVFLSNRATGIDGGAGGFGGAILTTGGVITVSGCTFINNVSIGARGLPNGLSYRAGGGGGGSGFGGAMSLFSATVYISQCGFYSNSVTGGAGGTAGYGTTGQDGGKGGGISGGAGGNGGNFNGSAGGEFSGGGGGKDASLSGYGSGGGGGWGGGGGGGGARSNGGNGGAGGIGGSFGGDGGSAAFSGGGGGGGGAGLGGALFTKNCQIICTNVVLISNTAVGGAGGGGVYSGINGRGEGGGIFSYAGSINMYQTIFSSNAGDMYPDFYDGPQFTIASQPSSAVVALGQPATLSVIHGGTGPFGYQWLKDGAILVGQTNITLSYTSFAFTNSGSYSVVITNADSMTISCPASLSVPNAPLIGWGNNDFGQLGNGSLSAEYLPITVASNVVTSSVGGTHSLFVKADGTLWSIGKNNYGQLGIGSNINTNRPVYVTNNVATAVAGSSHSLFVKTDGTLWSMGYNYYGELGNATSTNTNLPVFVTSNVVAVAAGQSYSMFIKANGTLWGMGLNGQGQLGIGTMDFGVHSTPTCMASNVVTMSAGIYHGLFIKTDGTLWSLGRNSNGQLGDGTMTDRSVPIFVTNNVVSAAAGGLHSVFAKADNTLWTMGFNLMGQLGNGTTISTNNPIYVTNSVVAIAACIYHTFFVKEDGVLWAMGYNSSGALGDGTGANQSLPVVVNKGFLRTASLATGGSPSGHSLAVAEILTPGLQVLGTNDSVIASGSAVSSLNGTLFPLSVFGTAVTNTFSITNNGTALMTISGAGIEGSGFTVTGIPAIIAPGTVASFDVVFNPAAAGSFTSTLNITNNSPTSIYTVNLIGSCYQLSVNRGPYAGSNSITITNGGFGTVTNVLVGGVQATITASGTTWVTITIPATGAEGVKDIVVQTSDNGDITLAGSYTYNPQGLIGTDANMAILDNTANGTASLAVNLGSITLNNWNAKVISTPAGEPTQVTGMKMSLYSTTTNGPNTVNLGLYYVNETLIPIGSALASTNVVMNLTTTPTYYDIPLDTTQWILQPSTNYALFFKGSTPGITMSWTIAGSSNPYITTNGFTFLTGLRTTNAGTSWSTSTYNNGLQVLQKTLDGGVTPVSGSWTGNYEVVISGINLGNGSDITNVTLCGVSASINSQSSTQVVVTAGVSDAAGLGDVRVFSTSFGETVKSNAFTYNAPGLQVLCSKGIVVTNGIAPWTFTETRHYPTRLGYSWTSTFGITNNGTEEMTISGFGLSGSSFTVSNLPSSVAVGCVSNFTVSYNPTAVGDHSAVLSISNDSPSSVYVMNFAGSCFAPSTSSGPFAGGNTLTVSNGYFGTVTNVYVFVGEDPSDTPVIPIAIGSNWFTIIVPPSTNAGMAHMYIQTSENGTIPLYYAYTYNPAGEIYNNVANGWTEVAGLPVGLRSLAAVTYSNAIYTIGGQNSANTAVSSVFKFDGVSWTSAPDLPAANVYHAADVYNGAIYSIGGTGLSVYGMTNVYRYAGTTWTEVAGLPNGGPNYGFLNLAAKSFNGSLYALGGYFYCLGLTPDVVQYNGSIWQNVQGLPTASRNGGTAVLGNKLYYIGGESLTCGNTTTNVYCFDGTNWTSVAGLPLPRTQQACVTMDGAIYVAGGYDGMINAATNVYRFDGVAWQEVAPLPQPFADGAGAVLNGEMYVMGGGNGGAATNVYRYSQGTAGVAPSSGYSTGNYQVVISGTNLCDGTMGDVTNVTLCGVAATVTAVNGSTQIVVTAGVASVGGLGDVRVFSTSFGETVKANAFTYLPLPPPPVALSAVDVTTNGFTARWTTSAGGTNYLIDVSETNTFTSFVGLYNNWSVGNATACLVTGLTDGTTYYYRLRAANSYGASLDSNIIEVPVSDNTPYIQYEPTNGVVSAGSTDVIDLTKLFHGSGMSYSVVSNSNPGLVATSFIGPKLILDYALGGSGTASITVRVTDLTSGFWVETTITVSVVSEPTVGMGPIVFNRQIGLFEQVVTVTNTSLLTAKGVTVTITNLSAGVSLQNATGIDEHGNPEIQWVGTLAPSGTMAITLQYYTKNRTVIPTSAVVISLSLEAQETLINGTTFSINGSPITLGSTQSYLIEFTAVPGRTYYIQYKATLGDPWKTVQTPIVAPVNRIQWIDSGPPSTESAPGSVPSRFYQVIELSL